ncbi:hypothetical protein ACFVT2_39955 [Streptomyces sp. NPDC058000]|uniref:hypothetical protein n=1 Tax=Streptomyces sp. NPDC058000 TaxID=3346299 RepID=UPI0036E0D5A0
MNPIRSRCRSVGGNADFTEDPGPYSGSADAVGDFADDAVGGLVGGPLPDFVREWLRSPLPE